MVAEHGSFTCPDINPLRQPLQGLGDRVLLNVPNFRVSPIREQFDHAPSELEQLGVRRMRCNIIYCIHRLSSICKKRTLPISALSKLNPYPYHYDGTHSGYCGGASCGTPSTAALSW
jgi:hypothetical protein